MEEAACVVAFDARQHTLLFLDLNGMVWQCGVESSVPVKVCYPLPPIVSVHQSFNRSYFIEEDGSVWGVGSNKLGQLGHSCNTLAKIPNLCNIKTIFSGQACTFFHEESGWLWGCGWLIYDPYAMEGDEIAITATPVRMNRRIPDLKAISINEHHAVYLDAEGSVWRPKKPLLKTARIDKQLLDEFAKVRKIPKMQAMTSMYNHTLLLDVDGGVWSFGNNTSQECGLDIATNKFSNPTKIPNIPPMKEVCVGYDFSVTLDEDGGIWGFGYNGQQRLWSGSQAQPVSRPKKLEGVPPAKKIICGTSYTMAVDEEGAIWAIGLSKSLAFQSDKFIKLPGLPLVNELERRTTRTKSARNV